MINSLHVKNFKCFKEAQISLSALTILCGHNNVGKSSFIQSLLLLREASSQERVSTRIVKLNGPFSLELGQVKDVLHTGANENVMNFSIDSHNSKRFTWKVSVAESNFEDQFIKVILPDEIDIPCISSNIPFIFNYLSAERLGPRDTQEIQSLPKESIQIGPHGEYTAGVLIKCGMDKVRPELLHPRTKRRQEENTRLSRQAELWMQELIPGIEVRAQFYPDTNIASIRIKKGGAISEWSRPGNIGFGVSFVLPIIVSGLLAPKDGLFIVENPESHLHPEAQSIMGRFLALLSSGGVQVIIETHSDHILNGVRLAAIDDHPIKQDNIIIHHFYIDPEDNYKRGEIKITKTGSLTSWPNGFLDQTERDLAAILKARRSNG